MIKEDVLDTLLRELLAEGWADSRTAIPEDAASKRHLLRTLMNIRPPLPGRSELIELQDRFLAAERACVDVTDPYGLPTVQGTFGDADGPLRDQLVLWRGDIKSVTQFGSYPRNSRNSRTQKAGHESRLSLHIRPGKLAFFAVVLCR